MGNALKLFHRIQSAFPGLAMKHGLDLQTGSVSMEIPAQRGLILPIFMIREDNGLRMKAGHFQLKCFPFSNRKAEDSFFNTVCGLLSGRLRVVEYYRGTRVFKAELQEPDSAVGWTTSDVWKTFRWPYPRKITIRVIRNEQETL